MSVGPGSTWTNLKKQRTPGRKIVWTLEEKLDGVCDESPDPQTEQKGKQHKVFYVYIHFLERRVALLDSVTCLVVVLGDFALGVNKSVNSPPSFEIL